MREHTADEPEGIPATRARRARWKSRGPLAFLAATFAVLALVVLWLWDRGTDERAIRALSPETRLAIYTRTMGNIEALCVDLEPSFLDYCAREAEFIASFEECDPSCQVLVSRILAARRGVR